LKAYLAKREGLRKTKKPAKALLELSGSWEDSRKPDEIVKQITAARRNSRKLRKGL